ncbi:inactive peptidyl-prolyl cis-trans isomerase FKBP6 isoform X3 [Misgurnus anguillicaudatus]|uniref:inactive peptidyl-prolyl cis-trans isomerase FKBP6 isoform X3 n=1 Tax=Misgurnus anguillicaudatus TaxID=75329 RepID=UPI0024359963|nr:inactive peptidyl-prolyl cis-trans isomerase FKBP6 isoform X3 [Misgurnus anguillicaudatus]
MSSNGNSARILQFMAPEERHQFGIETPYQRLAWQMQDILGDGGILKEVIHAGEGPPIPLNASVSIHFSGFLEYSDVPFETTSNQKHPRMMKLGRDVTLYGLELGLLTMKKGEFSRFLFKPRYAYGDIGCPPHIPPLATVLYEVQVLDFFDSAQVDEFMDLTTEEQNAVPLSTLLTVVDTQRNFGNLCFNKKRYEDAKERYQQACLELNDYEKAQDYLTLAQSKKPFDPDINTLLKKLALCYKEYLDKEKEMCSKMFSGFKPKSECEKK